MKMGKGSPPEDRKASERPEASETANRTAAKPPCLLDRKMEVLEVAEGGSDTRFGVAAVSLPSALDVGERRRGVSPGTFTLRPSE